MSCDGRCCAVFPLGGGLTYDELERRYHRINDGATIFDMVRPLTPDQARERALKYLDAEPAPDHKPLYRCVRWDETTRRCTRYAERPAMCSDYPYDGRCDHGCGHVEPAIVRLRWLGIKLKLPLGKWRGQTFVFGIPALTFPG